jgi:hypothetical protein
MPHRGTRRCSDLVQRFDFIIVAAEAPNFPRQKNLFRSVSIVSALLHAEVLQPFAL